MATLDNPFDASTVEVSSGEYDPLPVGWYQAKITDADLRTTKAGTGQYIAVRYDITGPTHQGRVVWQNLNISNPTAKAEEIGRQQLAQVVNSIGMNEKLHNTDQLIGGELFIKLSIRKSEEYGDQNEVKGCKAITENAPPPLPAGTSASENKAPWQK